MFKHDRRNCLHVWLYTATATVTTSTDCQGTVKRQWHDRITWVCVGTQFMWEHDR